MRKTIARRPLVLEFLLYAGVLAVYAALPARNYYWDGISFAQIIEDAAGLGDPALFHPNHLLYNLFGYALYHAVNAIAPVRALYVLQYANMAMGAAAGIVLLRILRRSAASYYSVPLVLLFCFSATWWRYATDANAYIVTNLFLLLCFSVVSDGSRAARPVTCALLHIAAMSFHELALLFTPVLLAGLYRSSPDAQPGRLRAPLTYLAIAAGGIVSLYAAAFYRTSGSFHPGLFFGWILSHSTDSSFSVNILSNLGHSLQSYGRLFAGGRPGLFLQLPRPLVAAGLGILAALLVMLVVSVRQSWAVLPGARRGNTLAALWFCCYAVFLFFWLPQNTFYKLFTFPALILLFAGWMPAGETRPHTRNALALLAACIAWSNLMFVAYPYSTAASHPAVQFAQSIGKVWSGKTMILYRADLTDNWYVRYFNPSTKWRVVTSPDLMAFQKVIAEAQAGGNDVWLDGTMLNWLASQPVTRKWLDEHSGSDLETADERHRIRFLRIR